MTGADCRHRGRRLPRLAPGGAPDLRGSSRARTGATGNVPGWLAERGAELRIGDVADRASQRALVVGCEILFHTAGLVTEVAVSASEYERVNVEGSEHLAQAAIEAGTRRIVFVSSTSVHAPNSGRALDESSAFEPGDAYGRIESRSRAPIDALGARTAHGAGDRAAFAHLWSARSFARTDLSRDRSPALAARRAVHGGDRLRVRRRRRRGLDADGDARRRASISSAGQSAYRSNASSKRSPARSVADCPPCDFRSRPSSSLPRCSRRAYTAFGREPPVAPKRLAFFRNSRVVDHSRAARDLGYDPAVGVREGVERTARWYQHAGWL